MTDFDNPVYQTTLDAGTHAYRMEVRVARNGSRYLKISDFRPEPGGNREFRGVMVFDNRAREFWSALAEAIAALDPSLDEPLPTKVVIQPSTDDRYAEIRAEYPRAYEPWTPEEEARLRLALDEEVSIGAIAKMLGRQPSAIRSRLRRLGLYK